jgi:hypothetical protein
LSWLGVTKYEEKETFRWPGNLDMFERNSRVGEPTERKALEAMVDNAAGKTQVRLRVRRSSCDKTINNAYRSPLTFTFSPPHSTLESKHEGYAERMERHRYLALGYARG